MNDISNTKRELYREAYGLPVSDDEQDKELREANRQRALSLVQNGWLETYGELFGQKFINALDSAETDDKHQSEALEWHWKARISLIKYELELRKYQKQVDSGVISFQIFTQKQNELQEKYYPDYWAYLAMWSRGNMKTTLARYLTIADAVLSYAYDVPGYALIVGGTVKKVRGTAKTLQSLLQSEKVKYYAPELSIVKKNEQGIAQGWTADFINTAGNYVLHFIGLDEGVAGANVDNIRPTLIIPDDIDDREDSPVISEGRFQTLTRSVLPTKQWNTLFFVAQNVISRFAVIYRIYKQQVKVFANRFPTKPIPAVRDAVYEERTVIENGIAITKDFIVSGKCTWRGWNLREVQNQIDTYTLPIFKLECQHEVDELKDGLVHKKYDDNVHPISYSQFAAVYGSPDKWKEFFKVPLNDWARTKTAKHANVAGYICVSNQNSVLPGMTFLVPLSFPKDTDPADVAVRLLETLTPFAYGQKTWRDLVDECWKRANAAEHYSGVKDRLEYIKAFYKSTIPIYSTKVLQKYNVGVGANSHSEDKVREMMNQGFGFSFIPANPWETDALEDIDEAMRVDYNLNHLFDDSKMGYTRWYVLCKDDISQEPKLLNGKLVYPPVPYPDEMKPDDLHDDDLFRYQMKNRIYSPPELTKTGEKVDVLFKANDDFGQMLQFCYFKKLLANIPLTQDELKEEYMPPTLRAETLQNMENSHEKDMLIQQRRIQQEKVERDLMKPIRPAGLNRFSKR